MTCEHSVLIVAAVPALGKRTRLTKIANLLSQAGLRTDFWGWEREPGEAHTIPPLASRTGDDRVLLSGGGYSQRKLALYYPRWVWAVFWAAVVRPPKWVHALGFESAFPVAAASLLRRGIRIIYDDADRMSRCYPMNRIVRSLFSAAERWVARRAEIHIVPGVERYPDGLPCKQTVILKNTPSQDVLRQSQLHEPTPRPSGVELVLYANGWIGETRGSKQLDALADAFASEQRVHFLAAGRLTGPAAQRFVKRDNVTYLGEVSNSLALAQYRAADLVLTFYDPRVEINRYAEPNKWGDCVALGVPFLVNEEVVTARPFLQARAAVARPFHDIAGMVELIRSLLAGSPLMHELRNNIRQFQSSLPSFDGVYTSEIITRCLHEAV